LGGGEVGGWPVRPVPGPDLCTWEALPIPKPHSNPRRLTYLQVGRAPQSESVEGASLPVDHVVRAAVPRQRVVADFVMLVPCRRGAKGGWEGGEVADLVVLVPSGGGAGWWWGRNRKQGRAVAKAAAGVRFPSGSCGPAGQAQRGAGGQGDPAPRERAPAARSVVLAEANMLAAASSVGIGAAPAVYCRPNGVCSSSCVWSVPGGLDQVDGWGG
jgi:hypothetical protein